MQPRSLCNAALRTRRTSRHGEATTIKKCETQEAKAGLSHNGNRCVLCLVTHPSVRGPLHQAHSNQALPAVHGTLRSGRAGFAVTLCPVILFRCKETMPQPTLSNICSGPVECWPIRIFVRWRIVPRMRALGQPCVADLGLPVGSGDTEYLRDTQHPARDGWLTLNR